MKAINVLFWLTIVCVLIAGLLLLSCEEGDDDDDDNKDDNDENDEFKVLQVQPDNGPVEGLIPVVVNGRNFKDGARLFFGENEASDVVFSNDMELSATVPAASENGYVTVKVQNPDGEYAELENGFLYGEEGVDIEWCLLKWPASTQTTPSVPTELIYGHVFVEGCTETPGEACSAITAQVGHGPTGTDPSIDPDSFTWVDAEYNTEFSPPEGTDEINNDEFQASIVEGTAGVYNYAYRFSGNDGAQWVYCDLDPGSEDGFSASNMGTLTVQEMDVDWCNIHFPAETTSAPGAPSEYIYSEVYVEGCTEGDGQCGGLMSQLGWGALGSDPEGNPDQFNWLSATFNAGAMASNNDEYYAQITESNLGNYNYAYRYSSDGGTNWKYCDLNGTDDGFSTDQMGTIHVQDVTHAIGWCNIQFPEETTTPPGVASELIFGQVYVEGCTEDDARCQGLIGQVGWGSTTSDPSSNPDAFSWQVAAYNDAHTIGNNDEYSAQMTENYAGDYAYAYRFSLDGGTNWNYCDKNGTVDGFTTDQMGLLHVQDTSISVGWCTLQFPASTSTQPGTASEYIFGRVYVEDCTVGGERCEGIIGQVGWGDSSLDPTVSPGDFDWSNAVYNDAHTSDDNDEYMVQIIENESGDYGYAYRFSVDGGSSWEYCDLDGSTNGFATNQMGQLTVE